MKLIGLSANTIEAHGGWIKDIEEIGGCKLNFPIIGDKTREIALLYDMYVSCHVVITKDDRERKGFETDHFVKD